MVFFFVVAFFYLRKAPKFCKNRTKPKKEVAINTCLRCSTFHQRYGHGSARGASPALPIAGGKHLVTVVLLVCRDVPF